MAKILSSCPSCAEPNLVSRIQQTLCFDPEYPNLTVAQNNALLEDVIEAQGLSRHLLVCQKCGLHSVSPVFEDDEFARLYSEGLYRKHYARVAESHPIEGFEAPEIVWQKEKPHSHFIFQLVKNEAKDLTAKTIVDIGGRYGDHLRFFCDETDQVYVQDIIEYPGRFPGVQYVRDLSELARVEVFVATHVLEHVPEVGVWVKNLSAKQEPGDLFYVEVPYELDAHLRRKTFGTPQHIYYYSEEALTNVFRLAGYKERFVKVHRLTCNGESMLVLTGLFERADEAQPLLKPCRREILRGLYYKVLDRVPPRGHWLQPPEVRDSSSAEE